MTRASGGFRKPLIAVTPAGLYCEAGGFHIDPWEPVPLALITHAHSDHARPGSTRYLCAAPGVGLLRRRIGPDAGIDAAAFGAPLTLGDCTVSFHPAGHVLGSAQIRVEYRGEVWVVSGDYKRAPDPTCDPFEVLPCHTFISEATFALPIYRWDEPAQVAAQIASWWRANQETGTASVVFCYALGKAQRVMAEVGRLVERPMFLHGAIAPLVDLYREAGVWLPETRLVSETLKGHSFAGELIVAPVTAMGSTWLRRFGEYDTALVSGWMRVRGTRRRRNIDRGFALSDHADWPALLTTIRETGASRVITTHGHSETLARFLSEQGLDTGVFKTAFKGEMIEEEGE